MNRLPQRRSIRLPEYDYSNIGCYYLTICTQNRELYFENNNIKQMIDNQWQELKNKFPNIDLDEWIVMPNHLHGIIVITNNNPDNDCMGDCRGEVSSPANITSANITPNVKTGGETPPLQLKPQSKLQSKPTLGQIIGYFKYKSTKQINEFLGNEPGQPLWQRNYFEHIIRNEQSLNKIRDYIRTNPLNWETDRNNPKNWKNYAIKRSF